MASFLDTLFGGGAEQEAAAKDIAAANQYGTTANQALATGYNTGTGAINNAIGAYAPLAQLGQTYSAAAPSYMAAIGVGTPDQVAAAKTNFANTPGYQEMLDAATQASNRTAAAGGMLGTGNAQIDAILKGAGITTQQYQQYINNLQQAGQMGLNATSGAATGQAAGYGSLANLATQYGEDQSGVAGNIESTTVGANNLAAAGQAAGAKNLLGAGLSLASLAATGGMSGLAGGIGSALTSGASNLFGNVMGNQWQQNNAGRFGSSYYGPAAPS